MNYNILVVDDEINILKSLRRTFIDSNHNILLAENGQQALEILKDENIDIIISDMKMPFMNGYELLTKVKREYPDVIRIILSGFAEKDEVYKAIREDLASRYLFKPWENSRLLEVVNGMIELKEQLNDKKIWEIIKLAETNIPIEEHRYARLLNQIEEESDYNNISETVESNPFLAARVLRFVNTIYHERNICSIKETMNYISMTDLKDILLTENLLKPIDENSDEYSQMHLIYEHSCLTKEIAAFVYEKMLNKKIPLEAEVAGLLHNLGLALVMKTSEDICQRNISNKEIKIEDSSISYGEIGGNLLLWWGLPYELVEVLLYHNKPFDKRVINRELVSVINISIDYASKILGHRDDTVAREKVFQFLGLEVEACNILIDEKFKKHNYSN